MENIITACIILSIVLVGAFVEFLFYRIRVLRICLPLVTVIGLVVFFIYFEKLVDTGYDFLLMLGIIALGFLLVGMFIGWLLGYAKYHLKNSRDDKE